MFWRNLSDDERRKALDHCIPELPICLVNDVIEFLGGGGELPDMLYEYETDVEEMALVVSNLNEIEGELTMTAGKYPVAHELLKNAHRQLRKHIGLLPYDHDELEDLMDDAVAGLLGDVSPN